jgi:hypothetical protein
MAEAFRVRATAGSLRGDPAAGFALPHAWTEAGVVVEGAGTGAHVLHTSVALCVLNDLYREADRLGLALDGVAVAAEGGFGPDWSSTGIRYDVELDSGLSDAERLALLTLVDEVAEIPRALRAGAPVERA